MQVFPLITTAKDSALKKILIIDDDEYCRAQIVSFLQTKNFDAITAENGFIGIILAKEQKPDLILCDVKMPVVDGYGVLARIRKDSTTNHIPLVFLTFDTDTERHLQDLELGVNDCLIKPVNLDEMLIKINGLLSID
jgi:DNA-binding response OmpR family regulator